MNFVIDRFEGEWAVLEGEDKEFYKISASALKRFKEGDVIMVCKNVNEINKRGTRIKSLSDELFG